MDIWTIEVKPGGGASRVTEDPGFEADPAWSGDGLLLAFNSGGGRKRRACSFVSSDGSGKDVRLLEPVQGIWSPDWSVDNKHIVYMDGGDLWTLPMRATASRPSSQYGSRGKAARLLADSRWVAYSLGQSSRDEVYIRAFPRDERSTHGVARGRLGAAVAQQRTGALLSQPGEQVMAVSIDPRRAQPGRAARSCFRLLRPGCQHRPFDVTRDGERFLVPTMRPSDDFRVVLNWRALLPR